MARGDVATVGSVLARIDDAAAHVTSAGAVDAPLELAIEGVTHDSRQVRSGSLFACLPGTTSDGHDFAAQAVAAGAVSLLVGHELGADVVGNAVQIIVDDPRRWLGPIASEVAGNPSRQLTTVGITGTNGKTTTASMLAAIFEAAALPTGVIGTLSGPRTTPEAPDLQRRLAGFVEQSKRAAVLEVSSHALSLHRVDGTEFDAVVFTNLGHDHLDLHGTHEAYFRAKAALFSSDFAPVGVINVDDTHGRLLADAAAGADLHVVEVTARSIADVEIGASTVSYTWNGHHVEVNMGGSFNVANSLVALVTATGLGVPIEAALEGLRRLQPVPGRFEVVALDDPATPTPVVVVDYAHTPDGLAEAIASARQVIAAKGRVIVVFGCGGDRDAPKRPLMGECAARLADRVIITSDNPRTEDPQRIIDDVLAGVDSNYRARVNSHVDRRVAINEAITTATIDDVVVVAGKGHETFQQVGDDTFEFDDREVAREALRTAMGRENAP